jgi:NAD(P)H-dependent flavin oxidoreductase YrpB (nitropropane dioxygenase family)
MNSLFNTTYPILCAPMNRVSEKNLAVACYYAGIFPSISLLCYIDDNKLDWYKFEKDLIDFNSQTTSNTLLVSLTDAQFKTDKFQKLLDKKLFTHLEIICADLRLNSNITLSEYDHAQFKLLITIFDKWKNFGYTILYKSLARFVILDIKKHYQNFLFDGFVLKGPNAAGMVVDRKNNNSISDDVIEILRHYPDTKIIASGGISTANDIKQLLNIGADAVAIGTVYAASTESILSTVTKNQMINSSSTDLSRFAKSNQNGLVFSKLNNDDFNNTRSLDIGIKSGHTGHIFAGHGIDNISNVLSVQHITDNLTKEL